jgi:hypothetical protein
MKNHFAHGEAGAIIVILSKLFISTHLQRSSYTANVPPNDAAAV